jgi:hypothetical protein
MIHPDVQTLGLCPYSMANYAALMKEAGLARKEKVATVLVERGKVKAFHGLDAGLLKTGMPVKDLHKLAKSLFLGSGADRVLVADLEAVQDLESELYGGFSVPMSRFEFENLQQERLNLCPGVVYYPGPPRDLLFACFTYREVEDYLTRRVSDHSSVTFGVIEDSELFTGFIFEIKKHAVVRWSNFERLRAHGLGRIQGLESVKKIVSAINRTCLPLFRGYFMERSAALKILQASDRVAAFGEAVRRGRAAFYQG